MNSLPSRNPQSAIRNPPDALLKLQYDLYYIKHQSLWLDIVILLKTIVDTVTLRGR